MIPAHSRLQKLFNQKEAKKRNPSEKPIWFPRRKKPFFVGDFFKKFKHKHGYFQVSNYFYER